MKEFKFLHHSLLHENDGVITYNLASNDMAAVRGGNAITWLLN